MNVTVLGTGAMGGPMARNLARAGHAVRVWNRTRVSAEHLGADIAATAADAVVDAEAVITMLADGPVVDAVMRDALPAMPSDAIWIQMSTVGVAWADRLAATAAERGIAFVDAPVMGSSPQAEDGALLPLASGPEQARERATTVLQAISRDVLWLGDGQAGSRLKLVANHWVLVSVENLAETLALADALELQAEWFFELISGAAFDMQYAHWKGAMMLEGEFPAAFALRLAHKDVGLALEAADQTGLQLPLAGATFERFGKAIELGHGDDDAAATYAAARTSGFRAAREH